MRWQLCQQLFCHSRCTSSSQCTVCTQCTIGECAVAVWVIFKFVFVFLDSCVCCQSASSAFVSQHHQLVRTEQRQSGRYKFLKTATSFYTEQALEFCTEIEQIFWYSNCSLAASGNAWHCMLPSESIRSAAVTQLCICSQTPLRGIFIFTP